MILADNETKVDLLNNEPIAATIVKLLIDNPSRPVTIGVHGDWGAGKSSVLEMIEEGLEGQAKVLCLKLNGWRFQGFEDAKIALIESIVTGLLEKRPQLTKAGDAVKEVFQRIDWLKVAKKAGGLAFTAHTGLPSPDMLQSIATHLSDLLNNPGKLTEDATKAKKELGDMKGLLKPAVSKSVPKEINDFRKSFDKLLEAAEVDRLVVLLDDLDRCLPDTAIETLEAVRLFVFTRRTAFVVAADEAMIEYSVRKHFPELPETSGPQGYARNYLEKLIQVPFRIPSLGVAETRIYVSLLLVGEQLGENDEAFTGLIGAARNRLKRPWVDCLLDAATIRDSLGEKAALAQDALSLSEQIGPLLARGTSGNPRQIKRFLNSLILRKRTAEARGFGEDVRTPVLAKLMLAERFYPRLFEQIASSAASSSDGICQELAPLEAECRVRDAGPPESDPGTDAERRTESGAHGEGELSKQTESAFLSEWLATPFVRTWASLDPPLEGVDLRPYLFITKDRKDHFAAASALGQLGPIVEQLLGTKLSVQALEPRLKQLAPIEAGLIFDALRGRIVGSDSLTTEPPGIAGMSVLVKAHPDLQGMLLDFLESLPSAKVGPWICKGWEGALKDQNAKERFDALLHEWGKSGSAFLKAAVSAVLKTSKGSR